MATKTTKQKCVCCGIRKNYPQEFTLHYHFKRNGAHLWCDTCCKIYDSEAANENN